MITIKEINGSMVLVREQKPHVVRPAGAFGWHEHGDELAGRWCQLCKDKIGYFAPFWFVTTLGKELMHDACWKKHLGQRRAG